MQTFASLGILDLDDVNKKSYDQSKVKLFSAKFLLVKLEFTDTFCSVFKEY